MTEADTDRTIRTTMASVLGVPRDQIGPDTRPETVESWDSLQHLNLVLALQEALDVEFEPEEITGMLSYESITEVVRAKLMAGGDR